MSMFRRGEFSAEVGPRRTWPRFAFACCIPCVKLARAALALLLVAVASPALADGPEGTLAAGYGWFSHGGERGTRTEGGLDLLLRIDGRVAPRVGLGLTFTWGLMDWDRAGEYIAAGNRAGSWTTDQFAKVERWATKKDAKQDTQGLRLLGAIFADMFLAMTYAAVPACYLGSAGGATSFLQLDGTVSLHMSEPARNDGWLELGVGAATLPSAQSEWRNAFGPVVGVGMRFGSLRIGARALWSPPGLNEDPFGGTIVAGGLTLGFTR
jgi:hypothetical protein